MKPRKRIPIPLLLPLLLLGAAACDEEDLLTEPNGDIEPPTVVVTSAPATSQANHEVLLEFEATDDVALSSATVDWGTPLGQPGGPVEEIPLEGTTSSLSCTHTYPLGGQFRIFVQVRDGSGHRASATHSITITEHAPEAPAGLTAKVYRTHVFLSWTPGAWAERQQVTLTRTDAPDAALVRPVPRATTASMDIAGLAWDADYTAIVEAENPWGRAASAQVAFRTAAPDPPVLHRFSALAGDPTCLVLEWSLSAGAESYRAALTADGMQDPIEQLLPSIDREARFCAATHPIVDGMTYTAQVFSVIGDRQYAGNALDFVVDFDPTYSLTGSWTGSFPTMIDKQPILLQLEDVDGQVTGSWEAAGLFLNHDSGPVSGIRTWGAIDLDLETVCDGDGSCGPNSLTGEFTGADEVECVLDMVFSGLPVTLKRD